jgi:hypothetical protein
LEVFIKELHVKTDPGALKEGGKIQGYIKEEKLDMNVIVIVELLICMRNVASSIKRMVCLRTCSVERVLLRTWNTMIMVFAMHGDAYKELDFFYANGSSRCAPGCCIITCYVLQWHIRSIVVLYH